MIYSFRPITHPMSKIHVLVMAMVRDVWCEASSPFHVALLDVKLKDLIEELDRQGTSTPNWTQRLALVHDRIVALGGPKRLQFKALIMQSNTVEEACTDHGNLPLSLASIEGVDVDLAKLIKDVLPPFYTRLLDLKAAKDLLGTKKDYYDDLVDANITICPFCGLEPIQGKFHTVRSAFDHYLPKQIYPLGSVDLANLVPICGKCNSGYKGTKDPLYDATKKRRKAHFQFGKKTPKVAIKIKLKNSDIAKLKLQDVDLRISAHGFKEEVDTWRDLFGIDERYKAACCDALGGKYWLEKVNVVLPQVQPTWSAKQCLDLELEVGRRSPLADRQFLRVPFLEACEREGICGV